MAGYIMVVSLQAGYRQARKVVDDAPEKEASMFDFFNRDHETRESKDLDRPEDMTEAEQASLDDRAKAEKQEKDVLKAARRDMIDNEEEGYLRQTAYDSVYETTRDEEIGR